MPVRSYPLARGGRGVRPGPASCAENGNRDSGSDSGAVVFGQLIGVSGDMAPFTPPAIDAAKIAIAEINDAGGVMGRDVKLVTEDNRSTVDGAVSGFSKLTSVSDVDVIGSPESDAVLTGTTRA